MVRIGSAVRSDPTTVAVNEFVGGLGRTGLRHRARAVVCGNVGRRRAPFERYVRRVPSVIDPITMGGAVGLW